MALTDLTRISTSGIATGTSLSGAILHGDAHFRGTQVGVTSALFDSSDNALEFNDNVQLKFGNSGDLSIYHTGNNSIIRDQGSGSLSLQSNGSEIALYNSSNDKYMGKFANNAQVELYHAGNKKFETTQTGAVVTGILTATSFSGPVVGNTNNASGISTFYDLRVSNNLTVEGTTTTLDTNLIGVDRIEVGANSNSVVGVAITQSGTADIVNLFDGGTNVLTVTDTGDVGIGTVVPDHRLHLYKENGDSIITIESTGNDRHSALEFIRTSSGGNGMGAGSIYVTGNTSASEAIMKFAVGHNVDHQYRPNMVLMGNGEVGIGTDNPAKKLEVFDATQGVIRIRGGGSGTNSSRKADLSLFASGAREYVIRADASDAAFKIVDVTGSDAERLVINSNGQLLVGTTTTPSNSNSKLRVHFDQNSSSGSAIEMSHSTNGADKAGAALGLAIDNGGASTNAASLYFSTANNGSLGERLRITSTGLVKINSASPVAGTNGENALLQVKSLSQYDGLLLGHGYDYGTISRGASNSALIYTANASPGNLGGGEKIMHEWWSGSSGGGGPNQLMVLSASGRLGIKIAAPTKLLDIATSTSADGIRIKSTGNTYNEIEFDANRTNATNHIGRIISKWNGTTVSYISFDTGSDTSNKDDGQIRFWTSDGSGNFERLRIDTVGRVSIGDNNAQTAYPFYVAKDLDSGGNLLSFGNTDSTYSQSLTLSFDSSKDMKWAGGSGSGGLIWDVGTRGYSFKIGGSEKFRIKGDGNVDINGTPPWTVSGGNFRSLSISGEGTSASGFIYLGNGTATNNADFDLGRIRIHNGATEVAMISGTTDTSANDDGRLEFNTRNASGSLQERMRINSVGRVAIGVNLSGGIQSLLNLKGDNADGAQTVLLRLGNDSSGSGTGTAICMGAGAGASSQGAIIAGFYDGTGTSLKFETCDSFNGSPTQKFRVTNDGKILCGDGNYTGAGYPSVLQVYGQSALIDLNTTNNNPASIYFYEQGSGRFRIGARQSDGFIIKDTLNNSPKISIHMNGDIRLDGGTAGGHRSSVDVRQATGRPPFNIGFADGSFYRNLGTEGPRDSDGNNNQSSRHYLHVRFRTVWNDYGMSMFRVTGYISYSDYTESYVGMYRYGHSGHRATPYGLITHNQKRSTVVAAYNTTADPGYLVIVCDWNTDYMGLMFEHIGAGSNYGAMMQQDLEIIDSKRSTGTTDPGGWS